jgi:hypothetical protein
MVKVCALVLAALALAGCNSAGNIDTKEAVRQSVIDYLAGRQNLNVGSMNVDVTSVSFKQNEAEAVVAFAPKGTQVSGQGMSMRYTLERKGSRWVVKGKTDSSSQNPHGAMPPGENPHSGAAPGAAAEMPALPPGHPTVPKK